MDYGARIKDLLTDRDMKQKALAKILNISGDILSNYVTGRTTIPPEVLAQTASYFSVTTDYLLGLTDDPAPPFSVTSGERVMLEHFRALNRDQKELILQNIDLMSRQNRRG